MSEDNILTGLNNNLILQRFKLNNKVALITGMLVVMAYELCIYIQTAAVMFILSFKTYTSICCSLGHTCFLW